MRIEAAALCAQAAALCAEAAALCAQPQAALPARCSQAHLVELRGAHGRGRLADARLDRSGQREARRCRRCPPALVLTHERLAVEAADAIFCRCNPHGDYC